MNPHKISKTIKFLVGFILLVTLSNCSDNSDEVTNPIIHNPLENPEDGPPRTQIAPPPSY